MNRIKIYADKKVKSGLWEYDIPTDKYIDWNREVKLTSRDLLKFNTPNINKILKDFNKLTDEERLFIETLL